MGHDAHFLSRLDRVSAQQADLALRLYRDEELLCSLLDAERLPADAERVAISLDDKDLGPFVVVARNGKFVTCLGRGMHPRNRPVITRHRLEEIAEHVEGLRRHMAAARELRPDGKLGSLVERIYGAGDRLTREEMDGLLGLKPVLASTSLQLLVEDTGAAAKSVAVILKLRRPRGKEIKQLEAIWSLTWAVAHHTVLCGGEEVAGVDALVRPDLPDPRFAVLRAASLSRAAFASLRAAWCVGTVGRPALEACQTDYREATWPVTYGSTLFALLALAWRHPEVADDVRRTLAKPPDVVTKPDAHPYWGQLWNVHCELVPAILDRKRGLEQAESTLRKLGFTWAQQLPEGSEFRSYPSHEEFPLDLALPVIMRDAVSVFSPMNMLWTAARLMPVIARANELDLYPSRALARVRPGGWSVQKGMRLLDCWRQNVALPEPTRVEKRPGPNQPCSCGSGKKYKRCCGGLGR